AVGPDVSGHTCGSAVAVCNPRERIRAARAVVVLSLHLQRWHDSRDSESVFSLIVIVEADHHREDTVGWQYNNSLCAAIAITVKIKPVAAIGPEYLIVQTAIGRVARVFHRNRHHVIAAADERPPVLI